MVKNRKRWTEVRQAIFVEKISLREACRRFGLNFRTVKKMAAHGQPPEFCRSVETSPKYVEFMPAIREFLAEESHLPRKQRYTAKRIFERLRDEHGYGGGERQVRRMVAALREKQRKKLFIPLSHKPGEAQAARCGGHCELPLARYGTCRDAGTRQA